MKFAPVTIVAAAAVAAGALAAPGFASAQPYGYGYSGYGYGSSYYGGYGGGYRSEPRGPYDPCVRDARQRGVTGGVLGAIAGAAIGSSVAGRGAKNEGGVLGGVLGAAIGSSAGRGSAACGTAPYHSSYAPPPPPPPVSAAPAYGYGYYDRYEDDRYDRISEGRRDSDGCQLAESPIYLPDGRTDKRYVRVCPDESGRYRVVD
jgi:hypothetical protein